ncbi:hypothetical protein L1887_22382 [Cichorium endivia]|nr:hypothetical protein L1887_22382 [Cichorium endivia]
MKGREKMVREGRFSSSGSGNKAAVRKKEIYRGQRYGGCGSTVTMMKFKWVLRQRLIKSYVEVRGFTDGSRTFDEDDTKVFMGLFIWQDLSIDPLESRLVGDQTWA